MPSSLVGAQALGLAAITASYLPSPVASNSIVSSDQPFLPPLSIVILSQLLPKAPEDSCLLGQGVGLVSTLQT